MYDVPKATLPLTGAGGALVVGGITIEQFGLLVFALGVVLVAATFVRVGFRRGKRVGDR